MPLSFSVQLFVAVSQAAHTLRKSNMASREIPELSGGLNGEIIEINWGYILASHVG